MIVIGAAKAGTSSMWMYLRVHPQIFMSARKELNFFCDDDWRERLDWYEAQFEEAGEPLRGEASVYYSMHPFKADVASRIAETVPDAKLIYIVRDPVPRAVAHYVQNFAVGYENRPIAEAFADFEADDNEYVCSSRYLSQLSEYLRFFERERILIVDQAELMSDREGVLRRVFAFLDVDETFTSKRFDDLANVREDLMRPTDLSWRLRRTAAARLVRRLPPGLKKRIGQTAKRVFDQPVEQRPELPAELAGRVEDHLRPEIDGLRDWSGLEFPSWSISQRRQTSLGA